MTEKEKMLAHQMYDANYNKELHDERIAAKELCWEYNQLRPSNEEGQRAVLKKLLGKTGENFYITAPFWCDYGYNIELGENFYANHNLVILDCAKVKFGDKCAPAIPGKSVCVVVTRSTNISPVLTALRTSRCLKYPV